METENDIYDLPLQSHVLTGRVYGNTSVIIEPDFNNPNQKDIEIPSSLKIVVIKLAPEIQEITPVGYRSHKMYDPVNFNPISSYIVGIDIYFKQDCSLMGDKSYYEALLNDSFIMTHTGIKFVTFKIESLIVPPLETNDEKFFKIFGAK
jgi:hypothetical protein